MSSLRVRFRLAPADWNQSRKILDLLLGRSVEVRR